MNYQRNLLKGLTETVTETNGRGKIRGALEIKFQKAAAEEINKLKQDLSIKYIEQRLTEETEKKQRDEVLSAARAEPKTDDRLKISSNCNILKMETGNLFGRRKLERR